MKPRADREGRVERDLLRGDRGDEALERVGRERRAEARELRDELVEHRLRRPPRRVNASRSNSSAEQLLDHRRGLGVERLDVDAAGRSLDPHLARADDAVQPALVPEVREVDARTCGSARSRARSRTAQASAAATSSKSSNGSKGWFCETR